MGPQVWRCSLAVRKGAGERRGAGTFNLQDTHAQRVNFDVGPRQGRRMGIGVYVQGAIVLFEEERQKIELHKGVAGVGLGVAC